MLRLNFLFSELKRLNLREVPPGLRREAMDHSSAQRERTLQKLGNVTVDLLPRLGRQVRNNLGRYLG
jgi:hypothetical protein